MSLLYIVIPSAVVLLVAYRLYGNLLVRLLELDPNRPTPAVALRDDVDYEPIEPKFLLSQHFSAIAAAGPIVGPILAGLAFGWGPALAWILIGSILIGGVHDMTALTASIRHKARSIAEVVRDHMSQRSYILFLMFVWLALVYIIVAFTDITAASFVGVQPLENGQSVSGAGIATSSLLYLVLPIIMGLLLRYTRLSLGWATVIFLPLVGVTIWAGQHAPLDLQAMLSVDKLQAQKVWGVLILAYCLVAGVVPLWMLLQPRGHLGGYFLYVALGGAALGLIVGSFWSFGAANAQPIAVRYPDFLGWSGVDGKRMLFPMLFITIACGACSGFHSLIASGTTSKQLRRETDAKPVAYGAMLLEAMVAIIALSCVMILARDSRLAAEGTPNLIYAMGMGRFLNSIGISQALAVSFGLMAFTTFVYDTLDVCTRLGRYIIQELTGWHNSFGRWLGTALTAGIPVFFVLRTTLDAQGKPVAAWRTFWDLFGASNQLLAALTLLGVTVWLWKTRRAAWVWFVTGLPTAFMYVMSTWALVSMILPKFYVDGGIVLPADPVPWVGLVLVALAALMLIEAIIVFVGPRSLPPRGAVPVPIG